MRKNSRSSFEKSLPIFTFLTSSVNFANAEYCGKSQSEVGLIF
jgi:hypothetical protein